MPGVMVEITEKLPERVTLAAEFGPGFVHVLVSDGLSQAETVEAIQDAWQAIREHYGADRIKMLEAAAS